MTSATLSKRSGLWHETMLQVFAEEGIEYLPYVPDKAISPLLDGAADSDDLELLPLVREEEGVGVLAGVHLAGRRGALLMQASGMGNCLNAIGSLTIAQRFPLLMIVSERGGLGENVLTQIPFGYALPRVLDAIGIQCHELRDANRVEHGVRGAIETAFISRAAVVLLLGSDLLKG